MKKDFIVDYWGCIILRLLGPVIRVLPLNFSFFLGRRLGDLFYYFDLKHKTIAYANIKKALGDKLLPAQINDITHRFYENFGQNVIELFLIPLIDKEYMHKYITIENVNFMSEGFKKGKGVIFLAVHAGSWELSGIICANLGFSFSLFVRDQRYPRLDRLLNHYRSLKGCRFIQKQDQLRQIIRLLKNNESIGMTLDQGGKTGTLVKFFGKDASIATGAIRLALKYDAMIIPTFYTRLAEPHTKLIIEQPFEIKKSGNEEEDIRENAQRLVSLFEKYIQRYPQEYLWSYKIWKYAKEKNVLLLSDGKSGHLRQTQAVAKIVSNHLKDKGITANIETVEVKFLPAGRHGKNTFAKNALIFSSGLAGKYHCQGCLWCLRTFLEEDNYKSLISKKPDIIISCGSSLASINFVLSRENLAKSIVVMRPSILSTKRFDLVIMPRHDQPPKRKNVVVIEGALNLLDEAYLKSQVDNLKSSVEVRKDLILGLLIGGDTKGFHLTKDLIREAIKQIKGFLERNDGEILVTTSRRTSQEVEAQVKEEFKDYPSCKLLIIANEKNLPYAVGGILGLSQVIIVSPESISMISEAASAGGYVVVFKSHVNPRHNYFLTNMAKRGYIYLSGPDEISSVIDRLYNQKPNVNILKDKILVYEALSRIL